MASLSPQAVSRAVIDEGPAVEAAETFGGVEPDVALAVLERGADGVVAEAGFDAVLARDEILRADRTGRQRKRDKQRGRPHEW